MRTFAVGDIHGCFDALQSVIKFANVKPTDRVVWLGDYVDRGPDSARVIEYLGQLPNDNNIFLRGNHEVMMERARHGLPELRSWAMVGGGETCDSYAALFGGEGLDAVPSQHWSFMSELQPYFESESHIFVHASVDSDVPMDEQFDDVLFWGDFHSIGPHESGKHVICGHTSQKSGVPACMPHATCIDTWVYGKGWLTCLDVDSGQFFQANQAGEIRTEWIDVG